MFGASKRAKILELENQIEELKIQRDKIKDDRETARDQREALRSERNDIQSQLDEVRSQLASLPPQNSIVFEPTGLEAARERLVNRAAELHHDSSQAFRIVHLNYATPDYAVCQIMSTHSALENGGLTETRMFGPEDLCSDFLEKNREIFASPRGNGFWSWKPHLILRVLDEIDEGDFLFYFDVGGGITDSIRPLAEMLIREEQDVYIAGSAVNTDRIWAKAAAIAAIGTPDELLDSVQAQGGCVLLRKSETSCELINRWSEMTQRKELIDDSPSEAEEHPSFRENRHDQALLSLTAKKMGIRIFENPDFYPENCERPGGRFALTKQFAYLTKFSNLQQ